MRPKNPFRHAAQTDGARGAADPAAASGKIRSSSRAVRWGRVIAVVLIVGLGLVAAGFGYLWQDQERQLAARDAELATLRGLHTRLAKARIEMESDRNQTRTQLLETDAAAKRLQDEVRRLEEEHRNVTEAHRHLETQMRTALESRDVTISELAGKLTVNILDRVLFASGEADITPEGQDVLRKVAGVLGQFTNRQVQVIGHTDNVPIRTARFPSNWELSAARAIAAVRFLTEHAAVEPQRLGALGYGEFHPVADNTTPEGRAQNRRIAIVILPELLSATDAIVPEPASEAPPGAESAATPPPEP